jgi:hypothetical protein
MVSQNGFKGYLLELLAERRAKRNELLGSIQTQLDELDGEIAALETTLKIAGGTNTNARAGRRLSISPNQLGARAHTLKEALEYMASQNDGIVHYAEARNAVMAAGLSRGKPRNVASHLYRMMRDDEDWEYVSPGTFRYLKVKPTLFKS